jgi:DNA gyrase subunit B
LPQNRDTKLEDRELFLIEGDSAGGTAKECRESYQGILPLRGKIDNALRGKGDKVLTSEEVLNILGAIGFDPKLENPYEKLTVGKIILLADPDPDGAHINTLLLTLFYKYLPEAFERGLIYVSYCPEFYAIHKGVLYSADGAEKLRAKMKKAKVPASVDIQHIKGWGEITPNLLSMLAMHPSSRSLIRIKPISKADSDFSLLMAEDVGFRKTLLGLA